MRHLARPLLFGAIAFGVVVLAETVGFALHFLSDGPYGGGDEYMRAPGTFWFWAPIFFGAWIGLSNWRPYKPYQWGVAAVGLVYIIEEVCLFPVAPFHWGHLAPGSWLFFIPVPLIVGFIVFVIMCPNTRPTTNSDWHKDCHPN